VRCVPRRLDQRVGRPGSPAAVGGTKTSRIGRGYRGDHRREVCVTRLRSFRDRRSQLIQSEHRHVCLEIAAQRSVECLQREIHHDHTGISITRMESRSIAWVVKPLPAHLAKARQRQTRDCTGTERALDLERQHTLARRQKQQIDERGRQGHSLERGERGHRSGRASRRGNSGSRPARRGTALPPVAPDANLAPSPQSHARTPNCYPVG
jgi:hypothetical protein